MKKIVLFITACLTVVFTNAQIKTPQPSAAAKVEQAVGLTDITVEYSRPHMRDRKIFGDLVPYEKLWRTGANKNTMITFSNDVKVGSKDVKAGTYAIFTTPQEEKWEVVLYTDTENWGTPKNWDASKVIAIINTPTIKLADKVESFTVGINNVTEGSASLDMMWENTKVSIPIEANTDATVMSNIEKVMAGPDARDYYNAAVYYSKNGKDIKQAKEWMDKAMSMTKEPGYWQLRQQSLIYAKSGDTKKAISTAKASLAAAEKAGNMDYVKMNKDSLKEWGAL